MTWAPVTGLLLPSCRRRSATPLARRQSALLWVGHPPSVGSSGRALPPIPSHGQPGLGRPVPSPSSWSPVLLLATTLGWLVPWLRHPGRVTDRGDRPQAPRWRWRRIPSVRTGPEWWGDQTDVKARTIGNNCHRVGSAAPIRSRPPLALVPIVPAQHFHPTGFRAGSDLRSGPWTRALCRGPSRPSAAEASVQSCGPAGPGP